MATFLMEILMATTPTPEFCRISWATRRDKEIWEPRIHRIQGALLYMERELVSRGHRSMAIQMVQPDRLVQFVEDMVKDGLVVTPCGRVGGNSYSSRSQAPGNNWTYRVRITRTYGVGADTDQNQGRLLGYPECCIAFFDEVWNKKQRMDTTLDMLEAGGPDGPVECNILLRWLGVRLVFHLPCSFSCSHTQELGAFHRSFAINLGLRQEMEWTLAMLSWPMEYSALHGAAEIVTPKLKITASTDYTKEKVSFKRRGIILPDYESQSSDNGFQSLESMDKAHEPILHTVQSLFDAYDPITIYDVGCGDGTLLQKLGSLFPDSTLFGVEIDEVKAQRARVRTGGTIRCANAFDGHKWPSRMTISLVSIERFKENSDLEDHLRNISELVLVYDYSKKPTLVRMTRANH